MVYIVYKIGVCRMCRSVCHMIYVIWVNIYICYMKLVFVVYGIWCL